MNTELQLIALSAALVLSLALNAVHLALPHKVTHGHDCPRCKDEAKAKADKRAREVEANEARRAESRSQAELQHEVEHKGFGFKADYPDRFNCRTPWCSRNK